MGKIATLLIITTTSLYQTGLLDKLKSEFEKEKKVEIRIVSTGSGAAFKTAKNGNCDLIIVHDRKGEEEFLKDRYGEKRYTFAYNEFVLCGPFDDPLKIGEIKNIFDAFKKIYEKKFIFISRGDDSGTDRKEKEIWEKLNLKPQGNWYIETGIGMSETLFIANEKKGYILTDISTFLFLRKKIKNLKIVLRDEENLKNFYSIITLNKERFPFLNHKIAKEFVNFVLGKKGREIIENFGYGFKYFEGKGNN